MCGYTVRVTHTKTNQTKRPEFLKTRETCFTLFSLAAFLSYVTFVGCFIVSRSKDSVLVLPTLSLAEDVDKAEMVLLFLGFVVIVASFSSSAVLYGYFQLNQGNLKVRYFITTAVVLFLEHWATVNTCHVFAISSLTLGKLS